MLLVSLAISGENKTIKDSKIGRFKDWEIEGCISIKFLNLRIGDFIMAKSFSLVQAVLGGGLVAIQPPVGQDWMVSDLGSSAIVGVAPAGVPNVVAGIFNTTDAVNGRLVNTSLAAPHVRGWVAPKQWYVNNTNYLQLINPEAGQLILSASIRLANPYGSGGSSSVISGTETLIATGVATIRPPLGEDWVITDIGSSRWVGAQPAGLPNVEVRLTDGINAALLQSGPDARGWNRPLELCINNANYLTLTNPVGAGATVSWSGYKARKYSPSGFSGVVSQVILLGAGEVATIRPAAGYEMKVTDIGCSVWIGAPPAALPSIAVAMTNGVINSVVQDAADNKGWDANMAYYLTRGNYMTITDAGAGSVVAVSAVVWKD